MAKAYRMNAGTRMINRVFHAMTRRGIGKAYRYNLSVRGRKSGRVYSTPVDVMSAGGERWVVAAYGVSEWVRNARAAGQLGLSRGGSSETVRVVELGPAESVPVLRQYWREVPVTRPYFDVTDESTDEEFAAEVARHPVFRLVAQRD
ncbi:nitroreductase/quinone reductase family protein [Streptomyces sp. NPDC004732]|uniref:nitroreductase/quinone reductase family protein n=1 Tax=Streptomyces sp. NPDC004732 TaxID=3154290 RepID=UPI0033A2ED60